MKAWELELAKQKALGAGIIVFSKEDEKMKSLEEDIKEAVISELQAALLIIPAKKNELRKEVLDHLYVFVAPAPPGQTKKYAPLPMYVPGGRK
jgi:hypothetical protein